MFRSYKIFMISKTLLASHTVNYSASSTIKNVGFVGLGNMGSKMSLNLVKKGYNVTVFDKNPNILKQMESHCSVAPDVKTVTENSNCIITMLPSGLDVLSLFDGVLRSVSPGTLVIDCSTTDPEHAVTLSSMLNKVGSHFIDAPVSGGVAAAEKGTLTFMVGGDEEAVGLGEPVLLSMGAKVIRCGTAGRGQTAKICNNMLLAISMIGLSEAMNLGRRLGLKPELLRDVINASSGRCWSSEVYSPVPGTQPSTPSSNDYKPGFSTMIMLKDLRLATEAATRDGAAVPLGDHAFKLYSEISKTDLANLDFSVVYKYLQSLSDK